MYFPCFANHGNSYTSLTGSQKACFQIHYVFQRIALSNKFITSFTSSLILRSLLHFHRTRIPSRRPPFTRTTPPRAHPTRTTTPTPAAPNPPARAPSAGHRISACDAEQTITARRPTDCLEHAEQLCAYRRPTCKMLEVGEPPCRIRHATPNRSAPQGWRIADAATPSRDPALGR